MSVLKKIFSELNIPAPGEDTDILSDDFSLPENSTGSSKLKISLQLETTGIVNLIARRKAGDTKATGTITVVPGEDLVDGDDFTINDGANPAVNFEFDTNAAIAGDVAISITGEESLNQIAYKVRDAINAAALDITAEVDPDTFQVLLTHEVGGTDGNVAILEAVTDVGFVVAGMDGGIDDAETVIPLNGDVEITEGTPHSEEILINSANQYNLQLDTDGDLELLELALNKDA